MKRFVALMGMVALLALAACSDHRPASQEGPVFHSISPREADRMMRERPDLALIDLREPQELFEGSIPGSQLVPLRELVQGRLSLPDDRPLLLICAVGGRSYAVGQYFSRKGYPEIYNLGGGIAAWKQAGLPLERR
ncbi:MAG: rhodanese-like domain-containing protein [Thermodesulfobacteriota bacterium]